MQARTLRQGLTLAVTFSLLTVFVAGTGLAAPTPSSTAVVTSPNWAWGGVRSVALAGAVAGMAGTFQYEGKATFGFSVIVNQTNVTNTTYTLHVQRTIGALLNVTYCSPNCQNPTTTATLLYHAWENASAWANLTTAGTVTEPTGNASALALINSSASVSAHVRDSASVVTNGVLLKARSLWADLNGSWQVTLSPPLGLMPLNVTPGTTWNSSSAFALAGKVAWNASYSVSGALVNPKTVDSNGTKVLNATGTVNLSGSYGGSTLSFGGLAYPAVTFVLVGPFSLKEGFLLVPLPADLFGPSPPGWAANASAATNATTSTVDVAPRAHGWPHLGFTASGVLFRSKALNLASNGSIALAPAATPASSGGGNATYVQGTPESIPQATADSACLSTGVGCPAVPGLSRGSLGGALALAVAVAVVAILVAALVTERRRAIPPSYPNAALYPPGSSPATGPAPRTGPRPSTPSPPAEEDPLSHLW